MTSLNVPMTRHQPTETADRARLLSGILDNVQDAILLADDRGRYIECSRSAAELTGYSSDELLNMEVSALAPEDLREGAQRAWQHFLKEGQMSGEFLLIRKDGRQLTTHFNARANILPGVHISVLRDVTRQQNAQDALVSSESRLRSMIDASPLAVQTFAPDGSAITANRAWEKLWGASVEHLAGYNVLQDEQLRAKGVLEYIERAFRGETAVTPPVKYDPAEIGKPGRVRWVEGHVYPVNDMLGQLQEVVLLLEDVTERVEATEKLHELNRNLEQLVDERTAELKSMIAELEGFTYSISHDLRTPLRAIQSSCMILIEDHAHELSAQAVSELRRQANAAQRVGTLMDELLQLSRISRQELRRDPVDLTRMAQEIVQDLESTVSPGTRFEIEEGLTATGDPRLLRLALSNLFENAIKFSPTGGLIRFQMKDGAFCISDEGIGFDPRYSDKLFLPFERLVRDEEYPGTGIGLANVQRILQRHGGRVWAVASAGKGSEFYFSLPSQASSR